MNQDDSLPSSPVLARLLADGAVRRGLRNLVRLRVPSDDVDDVVQETLTDALEAKRIPAEAEGLRKWLWGIARHKVADYHRRRKAGGECAESVALSVAGQHECIEVMQWAEVEVPRGPEASRTLAWLMREGQGETLAEIAEDEGVSHEGVRQRVSRMRRHFRQRWAAELAAVAAILLIAGAGLWAWRSRQVATITDPIEPDLPVAAGLSRQDQEQQARELREEALRQCDNASWQRCLEGLDRAAALDPMGDRTDTVVQARQAARVGASPPSPTHSSPPLTPSPSPSESPSPLTPSPSSLLLQVPSPTPSPLSPSSSHTSSSPSPAPTPTFSPGPRLPRAPSTGSGESESSQSPIPSIPLPEADSQQRFSENFAVWYPPGWFERGGGGGAK